MNGPELKALRKQLGLSATRASRQVEVSTRTWLRWEAGKQNIPEGAMKLFRVMNKLEDVGGTYIRTIERSKKLVERMRTCRLSGMDPDDDPEVQRLLLAEIAELPEAAKRLQDRQEAIQSELVAVVGRWHSQVPEASGRDVLELVFNMIKKVDEDGIVAISRITQDADARRLLTEYAEIDEQIIEILGKEVVR